MALVMPILVVTGWQGPSVRLQVLTEFVIAPWPAACFLAGLGVASVCIGAGCSPLPRRHAWPTVLLACAGIPAVWWFLGSLAPGALRSVLIIGLGIAIACLAAGIAVRRVGWGMVGFALLFGGLALLIMLLLLSGTRAPAVGTLGWRIGLATHQITYGLGYLIFLIITITAPVAVLTGTAAQRLRLRGLLDTPRRGMAVVIAGLAGATAMIWLLVSYRHRSPWLWMVAAVAVAAVLLPVRWTAHRPLIDRDERIAGLWVAGVVTLPYALLAPALIGAPARAVYPWAAGARDWSWALLLVGAGLVWLRGRRLSVGVALLLLTAGVAAIRTFGHISVDLKATATLLVLAIVCREATIRLGWYHPPAGAPAARARLAMLRAAFLALLVGGLLELLTDHLSAAIVFGGSAVVAAIGSLLLDQPGRSLPIPLRGAAYVRAAGWAVVVVAAQGLMLAARDGLQIAQGSQAEAADLLILPLLVIHAGFRRPPTADRVPAGPERI